MKGHSKHPTIAFLIVIFLWILSCEKPSDLLDSLDTDYWISFNKSNSSLPGDDVRDILIDSKGNVWFACYGSGVAKLNSSGWTTYNTDNSLLGNDFVTAILEDSDGDIWFGTTTGINFLVDDTDWYYYGGEGATAINTNTLFKDIFNNVWIGTEGDGIYAYDDGYFYGPYFFEGNYNMNLVNYFTQDKEGNLWVATDFGIQVFDGSNWESLMIDENNPQINVVYSDSKGRIWIASDESSTISTYRDGKLSNRSLLTGQLNNFVYDITEDLEGNIWFATFLDGLVKFDGIVMNSFKPFNGFPSIWNNCLAVDEKGSIWTGTLEQGVYKYIPPVRINK